MKQGWAQAFQFAFQQTACYFIGGFVILGIAIHATETTEDDTWAGVTLALFSVTAIVLGVSSWLTATLAGRMNPGLGRRMTGWRAGMAGLSSFLLLWTGPGELALQAADRLPLLQTLGLDGTTGVIAVSTLTIISASTLGMIMAWALPPWASRVQSTS